MFWNIFFFFSFCNHLKMYSDQIRSDQLLSRVRPFVTPWIAARQDSLSITNSQTSLKLMSIESVMPSSYLIICCPLLFLPSIPPSIRVFSNELTLRMRWPKYWSLSLASVLPMNTQDWSPLGWTGWISLQSKGLPRVFSGTKFKNISSLVLNLFTFFMVHGPSHICATGKIIALIIWTFVSKVTSLLFNALSRFVAAFLPRSKRL